MIDFKALLKGAQKFTSDNSPSILTAVAVAGVVSTAIFAVRGTARAIPDIMHAESERVDPLTFKEKVQLTWKSYIPALGMGAVTIACIVGANSISTRRNAALVSVYTVTETAFKEYREKVIEQHGENKEQKVRDAVAQDRVTNTPGANEIYISDDSKVLWMDTLSGRYFKNTTEGVRKAVNDVNEQIINENYASLNEFYEAVGLSHNRIGDEIGWNTDQLLDVDISATVADDGKPCMAITYRVQPSRKYHKFF